MQELILLWQNAAPAGAGAPAWTNFLFIGAAIAIIYFMLIRPQSQQKKKASDFSTSLTRGQKVVTIGGIHGYISEIKDNGTIELVIMPKVHMTIQRDAISMEFTKAAYGDQQNTTSDK